MPELFCAAGNAKTASFTKEEFVVLTRQKKMDPASAHELLKWIKECDDPALAHSLEQIFSVFGGVIAMEDIVFKDQLKPQVVLTDH
jgi:hypothetical protein